MPTIASYPTAVRNVLYYLQNSCVHVLHYCFPSFQLAAVSHWLLATAGIVTKATQESYRGKLRELTRQQSANATGGGRKKSRQHNFERMSEYSPPCCILSGIKLRIMQQLALKCTWPPEYQQYFFGRLSWGRYKVVQI